MPAETITITVSPESISISHGDRAVVMDTDGMPITPKFLEAITQRVREELFSIYQLPLTP